jgi:gamma-glutamyltranspeptidase/glutathione hydrolase
VTRHAKYGEDFQSVTAPFLTPYVISGKRKPQPQAAIFTRQVLFRWPLQDTDAAPRWRLGRAGSDETATFKLGTRFDPAPVEALRQTGHAIEPMAPLVARKGYSGARVCHDNGVIEGAADPRSDGCAVGH